MNPQAELPSVMEQYFVNSLNAKFFLKTPQKEEIDIIYAGEKTLLPVEIKLKAKIERNDIKTLFKFIERNKLDRALLITLDTVLDRCTSPAYKHRAKTKIVEEYVWD